MDDFAFTATLVVGSTDVQLFESVPLPSVVSVGLMHDNCAISGTEAVCTQIVSSAGGVSTWGIQTLPIVPQTFAVTQSPPGETGSRNAAGSLRVSGSAFSAGVVCALGVFIGMCMM